MAVEINSWPYHLLLPSNISTPACIGSYIGMHNSERLIWFKTGSFRFSTETIIDTFCVKSNITSGVNNTMLFWFIAFNIKIAECRLTDLYLPDKYKTQSWAFWGEQNDLNKMIEISARNSNHCVVKMHYASLIHVISITCCVQNVAVEFILRLTLMSWRHQLCTDDF